MACPYGKRPAPSAELRGRGLVTWPAPMVATSDINTGALALPDAFPDRVPGGGGKRTIGPPGSPQECIGHPLTSRRNRLHGLGNRLPQLRIWGGFPMPVCQLGA